MNYKSEENYEKSIPQLIKLLYEENNVLRSRIEQLRNEIETGMCKVYLLSYKGPDQRANRLRIDRTGGDINKRVEGKTGQDETVVVKQVEANHLTDETHHRW